MTHFEKTDAPRQLDSDLWVIDGDWQNTSLRRRMTIIRLEDGSLWLHSPIALQGSARSWLESLGSITWIIAPNSFHGSDLGWYLDQYPESFGVGSDPALPSLSRKLTRNLLHASQLPSLNWEHQIESLEIKGSRLLNETVFFHPTSKTLILTDLAFHLEDDRFQTAFEKWLTAQNRIGGGRFGPSWLAENFFFKSHQEVARSLRQVVTWDFDRIIVNHGNVVETDGRSRFQQAFSRWLRSKKT
jgi:hypothetical protein